MERAKKSFLTTSSLVFALTSFHAFSNEQSTAYQDVNSFGGPAETGAILEGDNQPKYPHFRVPSLDGSMNSWQAYKDKIAEDTGFKFGLDFTSISHTLSDTLDGTEDSAHSYVARFYGKWALVNKDNQNTGSLTFKVDHRNAWGNELPVASLGGNAGYYSQTAYLFSDKGNLLVDLNWQQKLNDGKTGFIVGKFDPNDFFDVLGYATPWTAFNNLDTSLNMSIALPDNSYGFGAGHWLSDNWYLLGAVNDANGTVDTNDPFEEGFDELYKTVELGWSPSADERYFKNFHVTLWQMDDHTAYGESNTQRDGSEGIVFGANWTWDLEWMLFTKFGLSDYNSESVNNPQLYEKDVKLGFLKYFKQRSDLLGASVSHGILPDEFVDALGTHDSQTTLDIFYRIQLAQRVAITPNLQFLKVADKSVDDTKVFGIKFRITL
ncbi:hypothetical protein HR060_12660 [Catenovulum sp. SM1970]|nr:hypothetical protein [Marinifaba aquimaris]